VENPFVNLLAIVGLLVFAIGLIPGIMYLGTQKAKLPRE
jgi:hypothetical protein